MENSDGFTWRFQRLGGVDHALLDTADALCRLNELDPKLWGALSCPAAGLEIDARVLGLIDTDKDGRIRIPEILAAAAFVCERLVDPAAIVHPGPALPLAAIRTDTPAARRLGTTARTVLENLGKPGADGLTRDDMAEAASQAAKQDFNGDGIVPVPASQSGVDDELSSFIKDAISVAGGLRDAGGQPGIDRAFSDAFMATLREWQVWRREVSSASSPLGDRTSEAWGLLQELKDKIDDYFLRCDLAAFAPSSTGALNACPVPENACDVSPGLLDMHRLADMPLARVEAERPLHLASGLNPAWRERVERFFSLAAPLLKDTDALSKDGWRSLQEAFAPYAQALSKKPAPVRAEPAAGQELLCPPSRTPDDLGAVRVEQILASGVDKRFHELADKDAAVPAASADIAELERLVLYYLHLHRLLMNFVSFYEFYATRGRGIFQAGTLFMDGRSCHLVLPVEDAEKHATLAVHSQLCLLYCDCRRKERENGEERERAMGVVAAMTAGDADLLLEGRNGVFVDNTGKDWDATLVKLVSNPISIWQALWQPYKRFGRMITEQIAKFAGGREDALTTSFAKGMDSAAAGAAAGAPPAPAQSFDIGKSVGIFAAIGLAIGAIGTALASIASALFSLAWWQFPLIIVGAFILISGPSFVLAWLKLRKRTLGPLLEASGWAVNSLLPINLALGRALTDTAALPPNAERGVHDPLKKPSRAPWLILAAAVALGALAAWLWLDPVILGRFMGKA